MLFAPAAAPFQPLVARLDAQSFPNPEALNALRDERHRNAAGLPICFAPPSSGDEGYEARILRSGEVATRERSWHDLFNALAWLAFPQAKRELNRLHCLHARDEAGRRGRARDALTLFDESGVLIACADASLAQLLEGFQWKALFVERRDEVRRNMCFIVFGHALQAQLLEPYAGITGRALRFDVDEGFMQAPLEAQLAALDARCAGRLAALGESRALAPLPLLGIPGWDAGNDSPAYYDNTAVFRSGRRVKEGDAAPPKPTAAA